MGSDWHGLCHRPREKVSKLQATQATRENRTEMDRWNDTYGRRDRQAGDGWAERARRYLRSRTADHWLMFFAGLLIGAILA